MGPTAEASPSAEGKGGWFNLSGEVGELISQERQARWFAILWLVSFVVLGLVWTRIGPGSNSSGNSLVAFTGFLVVGTLGIWVWLGTSVFDPLVGLSVDSGGISARTRKKREYRYAWSDQKTRIRLWRYLGSADAPLRKARAEWYISVRPPHVAGRVPDDCYGRLIESAAAAGLNVVDDRKSTRHRHSVQWMGETRIGH